jgi:uncharacterized protein (DUF934 family)
MSIAICAVVKNEGPYLREWIAYYNLIGFDKFYICNNESEDDTKEILEQASSAGLCVYYDWPNQEGVRTQAAAYKYILNKHRNDAEWMFFCDPDEFLVLKKHDTIDMLLQDYPEATAIGFNWKIFGDSGRRFYEKALLMERFTYAAPEPFGPNHLIKTIARSADIITPGAHTHQLCDGALFIDTERRPLKPYPAGRQDTVTHRVAQLNHYYTKSAEEYSWKLARGRVDLWRGHKDFIPQTNDHFHFHNRNDEVDTSALRLKEKMAEKMKYIFGSN